MKETSALSLTQTPEAKYCWVVGLVDGKIKLKGPFPDAETAEADVINEGIFTGGDYKFYYSRFRNVSPSRRMQEQLMKDLEG